MIDEAAALINANDWQLFQVTADKNKAPIVKKGESWKHKKYRVDPNHDILQQARTGKRLLAAITPDDIVVLDIDNKKALEPLCKTIDLNLLKLTLAVETGAGYHLYFKKPKKLKLTKLKGKLELFKQIDIRQNGYMIIPPSLHWQGKRHYERIANPFMTPQPMPKELKRFLKKCYRNIISDKDYLTATDVKHLSSGKKGEAFITLAVLETALNALSPSHYDSLDDFFRLTASVHHATGGNKEAREMFISWARSDDAYNEKEHVECNRRIWNACK